MVERAAITAAVNTALPRARRLIASGFRSNAPARCREAATLLVLFTTGCRPGNARYTRENATRGLTTLTLSHLHIRKTGCVLVRYVGKKQIKQQHEVCSPDLVKWIRYCTSHGERVFQRRHELIATLSPMRIRPKDVRTWKANQLYKCHTKQQKLSHAEAVRNTARALGNTPSVTARSYIAPELQDAQRRIEAKRK